MDIGATAIKSLLEKIELKALKSDLVAKLTNESNAILCRQIEKRLCLVNGFINSNSRPEWMILTVLPVLPPNIRPCVPLEDGRFATSDVNSLYCSVINRNNRLKNLLQLRTPEVIIRNEKCELQKTVDALIENGLNGETVTGPLKRNRATGNLFEPPLKSLTHLLGTGREWNTRGHFTKINLGKMVDYSSKTVAVPNPDLPDDMVLVPYEIAKVLWEPFVIHIIESRDWAHTARGAKKLIEHNVSFVRDIISELLSDFSILITHPPVINNYRARFFRVGLTNDSALHLSSAAYRDMEFDSPSSQAKIFLPLSNVAQYEAKFLTRKFVSKDIPDWMCQVIVRMLDYDNGQKPLLCPSYDYAISICHLKRLPINTHIQLPQKIHTSIGGALLASLEPSIMANHLEDEDAVKKWLKSVPISADFIKLLSKYSYLASNYTKNIGDKKILRDDYLNIYEASCIRFQKGKLKNSLPRKHLQMSSVYMPLLAEYAQELYCKNDNPVCTIKDCPAHGLSGNEYCLCADSTGQLPDFSCAVGLQAVYKIMSQLEKKNQSNAMEMLYKDLLSRTDINLTSMDEVEKTFYLPADLPKKEIELLLSINKQYNLRGIRTGRKETEDFFYDAVKNPPEAILNAMIDGRKIKLDTLIAVKFSGCIIPHKIADCALQKELELNTFSGGNWVDAMIAYPKIKQHCPWEKFSREDFIRLLNYVVNRYSEKKQLREFILIVYQSKKLHIEDWGNIFCSGLTWLVDEIFTKQEADMIKTAMQHAEALKADVLKQVKAIAEKIRYKESAGTAALPKRTSDESNETDIFGKIFMSDELDITDIFKDIEF